MALLILFVMFILILKALIPGGRIVPAPGTEILDGGLIILLFLKALRNRLKMPAYQRTSWVPTIVLLNLSSIYDEIAVRILHLLLFLYEKEKEMANIKEIARLANVSVSTVSRVLNHHPYVSEEKRKLVHQVMKELDYTPNRTAIDLIRGKTHTVGVILPYSDHPCFDKIVNGITKAAFQHEYATTLLPTNYNPDIEIKYLELLRTKKIDGLIITSRANHWDSILAYQEYGPVIACEDTGDIDVPCAFNDRKTAYAESFRYLKSRGHENIAFTCVREADRSPSTADKAAAYKAVCGRLEDRHMLSGCNDMNDGELAAEHFYMSGRVPTAIYANSDEVAAGIHLFAKKNNWDVEIIGEGNTSISRVLGFPSLDLNLEQLGIAAFSLFLQDEPADIKIQHKFKKKA
ncbi:Transcriptional repressor of carbon supply (LacIfamily) [Bacillus subtilis QB928]|nr:Transcriptional repressor of carbon supply (LacIfamily) [Bacillus subtilis QB928]